MFVCINIDGVTNSSTVPTHINKVSVQLRGN
uniref:Uncharacterized protein n=1 Tax=Anguilla anguilla TaxID=7936 RepID=A0A0E9THX9_ANGAN